MVFVVAKNVLNWMLPRPTRGLLRSAGCRSSLSSSRARPLHSADRTLVTSGHPHRAASAAMRPSGDVVVAPASRLLSFRFALCAKCEVRLIVDHVRLYPLPETIAKIITDGFLISTMPSETAAAFVSEAQEAFVRQFASSPE